MRPSRRGGEVEDVEGGGDEAAGEDLVSMRAALGRKNKLNRSGLG
jgi:hypothetical protein